MMGLFALAIALLAGLLEPEADKVGPLAVLGSVDGLALNAALGGLALAGGLFIVPAFAAVQAWSPPEARARVIAAVNVMNAAYMVAGGAVVAALQALGVGVTLLFAALGVLSIAAIAVVVRALGRRRAARCRPLALRHTGDLMRSSASVRKWDDGPARVP